MKQESEGERYSCCTAALQLAHSRAYSTAWECVRMIRCDSFSELPGFLLAEDLGTSWTVRIAMLNTKRKRKEKNDVCTAKISIAPHRPALVE
jgi:hypothetical protein